MFTIFLWAMFLTTFTLLTITRLEVKRLISHHHQQKCNFFRQNPIKSGDIVFVGDSLTDGARWDELFPGKPVKNRGINADTVTGVLSRLDDIISGKPASIFLLVGTNDLPWYEYRGDAEIVSIYRQILEKLKDGIPSTRIYAQSILPRHFIYSKRINRLNARIKSLTEEYDYVYINLFPSLADSRGGLQKELTNDNLHLLGKGYEIWADLIRQYV